MATKTEIKNAQQKEELLKVARDALEIFRKDLERDDYVVEVTDVSVVVTTTETRGYLTCCRLSIVYRDMDIIYKPEKTEIVLFDKEPFDATRYNAPELHDAMAQLHEIALQKVRERIEKALKYL